jgi:hypothetical protein
MYSSSAGLATPSREDDSDGAIDAELGLSIGSSGHGAVPYGSAEPGAALATAEAPVDVEASDDARIPVAPSMAVAIAVCVGVTILFGVWPGPLVSFAHHALLYSRSVVS